MLRILIILSKTHTHTAFTNKRPQEVSAAGAGWWHYIAERLTEYLLFQYQTREQQLRLEFVRWGLSSNSQIVRSVSYYSDDGLPVEQYWCLGKYEYCSGYSSHSYYMQREKRKVSVCPADLSAVNDVFIWKRLGDMCQSIHTHVVIALLTLDVLGHCVGWLYT